MNLLSAEEPQIIPLWEGVAPGSENYIGQEALTQESPDPRPTRRLSGVAQPTLKVFKPKGENTTRSAVLIFPGGGYEFLSIDKEGDDMARWFAERGVMGITISYRHGGGMHEHPVPLNDGHRAIELVRQHADDWNLDPNHIGAIGFSAGGHLAASVATHGEANQRPSFVALIYPVISMREGTTHKGSRRYLMGEQSDEAKVTQLSCDEQVDELSPPAFLAHTTDDFVVPVDNSIRYYNACRKAKIDCELHVYPKGGHGYGMRQGPNWSEALETWLQSGGWMAGESKD